MTSKIIAAASAAVLFSALAYASSAELSRSISKPCDNLNPSQPTRFVVHQGNLADPGTHEVSVTPVDIKIEVSPNWGGGIVDVPASAIKVSLSVERRIDRAQERPSAGMTLNIIAMRTTVQSVTYPHDVISGLNTFTLDPGTSTIVLDASSGTTKFHGSAQAALTNTLFSSDKPAKAEATFAGSYDFKTGQGTITTLAIKARSPKKT
jgi:hypothetical protein